MGVGEGGGGGGRNYIIFGTNISFFINNINNNKLKLPNFILLLFLRCSKTFQIK